MRRIAMLFLVLSLAGCQGEPEPSDSGLAGYDPNQVENQRAACAERGGRFAGGGLSGRYVCYETTPDANASCSSASDCEAGCLARSRTCAPVKPLLGCNEFIGASGLVENVCLN